MFFCSRGRAIEITRQLNGQKFWIFGNHDKKSRKWKDLLEYFVWTGEYKDIRISDDDGEYRDSSFNKIILMHYPIASWDGMHHGSWMLHGHSHATYHTKHNKIMDVGIDSSSELAPFTYEEVKKYMATRKFVPVDGHGLGKE